MITWLYYGLLFNAAVAAIDKLLRPLSESPAIAAQPRITAELMTGNLP